MRESCFSINDLVQFEFIAGASRPVKAVGEIIRIDHNKKCASIRCGGFVYLIPFDRILSKVSKKK